MSDINGPKFSVNQLNFNNYQKAHAEAPIEESKEETKQINDCSDPNEVSGRSLLFKGIDDTKHDLKALIENPQIAENSDKAFETAYKAAQDANIENPYEEAATFATDKM